MTRKTSYTEPRWNYIVVNGEAESTFADVIDASLAARKSGGELFRNEAGIRIKIQPIALDVVNGQINSVPVFGR